MAPRRSKHRERSDPELRGPEPPAEVHAPSFDRAELLGRFPDLPPSGSADRPPALAHMVKADLQRQWQGGRPVTLESYLEAFPELGTRDTVGSDLILAEYGARCRSGAPAELAQFAERFPRQADLLRTLVLPGSVGGPGTHNLLDRLGEVAAQPGRMPTGMAPAVGAPADLPGHFGRYRILKRLGHGSMGMVYLAEDPQLGRRVALKVPHHLAAGAAQAPSQHDLDRFHQEARAAATLFHPNLCPVYEAGQVDGVPYLTMAFIPGRPLSRSIDPARPLPPRRVAGIVRKLARAMEEAHRHGVVHRDLKPSNIMVGARRELVIMDFGLAWRVGAEDKRLTRQGLIVGTPAYMSPEQLAGRAQDLGPRCDIYSLGVIMYELLTALRPFEGSEVEVIGQILCVEPVPPTVHRPDLDDEIAAICMRAMAKRPEDRYATMSELASDLADYLGSGPLRPRPPEPAPGPSPRGRPEIAPRDPGGATPPISPDPAAGSSDEGLAPAPLDEGSEDETADAGPADAPGAVMSLWAPWNRWASIVETIALHPDKRPRISHALYERAYKDLIEACRSRAATVAREEQVLYRRIEGLVLPWMTPDAIHRTDQELLFSLLGRFEEIERQIEGRPRGRSRPRDRAPARSAWAWGAAALLIVAILTVWLVSNWAAS